MASAPRGARHKLLLLFLEEPFGSAWRFSRKQSQRSRVVELFGATAQRSPMVPASPWIQNRLHTVAYSREDRRIQQANPSGTDRTARGERAGSVREAVGLARAVEYHGGIPGRVFHLKPKQEGRR